jgi:hypothetical protein
MGVQRGPRRIRTRILLAVFVVVVTLITAMFWTESTVTPRPTTLEGWLYDYYYNATRLGYDRGDWGGRVIRTDDPEALINLDPANLTVPVFVRIPTELTDDYLNPMIAKFFPSVEASSLIVRRDTSSDGTIIAVIVRGPNGRLEIDRDDGGVTYYEDRPSTPGVSLETNESAMRYAVDWLKAHGAWPSDAVSITLRRLSHFSSTGEVLYSLTAARKVLGFAFYEMVGRLCLDVDAATGRIDKFLYDWPQVSVPFVCTDLPPLSRVLDHFNLTGPYLNDETFSISENLTYHEASVIWEMGLDNTAPIYFYLPYRWIGYCPGYWSYGSYGAIFPEVMPFIYY